MILPARSSYEQNVAACNQHNTWNRLVEITSQNNDTGIQHGGNNAGDHDAPNTQDTKTELSTPERPIQGVIRIFRRLGSEHDAHIPSSGMFKTRGEMRCFLIQNNCAWNVLEFVI